MTNKNGIHECEWKKGKLAEAFQDHYGNITCARCGELVPIENTVYQKGYKK